MISLGTFFTIGSRALGIATGPVGWIASGVAIGGTIAWQGRNGNQAEEYTRDVLGLIGVTLRDLNAVAAAGVSADAIGNIVTQINLITSRRGAAAMSPGDAATFFRNIRNNINIQPVDWPRTTHLNAPMNDLAITVARFMGALKTLIDKLADSSFNLWWKLKW